jgi:hypothetical protein
LEDFKSSSTTENRRAVSETYSFIYDDLIATYYSLGAADRQYALLSAGKALEYAELNKARVFAKSWGQVFTDGLRAQVPAQLQEQERVLLARQASLQSELQESMVGAVNKSIEQVGSALDSVKKQQPELVQHLRETRSYFKTGRNALNSR